MTVSNTVKRTLVIGQGSIGKRHMRLLSTQFPALKVASFSHRRLTCNAMHALDSVDDPTEFSRLLEFKPDAAIVAGPASSHVDIASYLVESGIHVLIEKPLAINHTGVLELQSAAQHRGCIVMVGYNLRFSNSLNWFRQCLIDRLVGEIVSVRCEVGQYLPDWRGDTPFRQSVSAQRLLGGGVLLELSHELDYLQWLFGPVSSVYGQLLQQSEWGLDVEDTAHILLTFEPRNNRTPLVASLNMDFVRRDTTRTCVAIGEEGSVKWDAITGQVAVRFSGSGDWQTQYWDGADADESYRQELGHFLDCISGQQAPMVGICDGLRVLDVVAAVRKSSKQRQAVSIA